MRKIEVPTNTPTEFELGDTAAVVQRRGEEREFKRKRERGTETEGGSHKGRNYILSRGGSLRKACKGRQKWHRNGHRGRKRGRGLVSITHKAQERAHDKHLPDGLR